MVTRTGAIRHVGLGNHDTGICSAGLHNCDEQGFCLDHHSVVLITDEEIDHLGSGFIFIDVGDGCWTRIVSPISPSPFVLEYVIKPVPDLSSQVDLESYLNDELTDSYTCKCKNKEILNIEFSPVEEFSKDRFQIF